MSLRTNILMITYRSAGYLDLSLTRLLESCGEHDRVWIWHNGDDEATLETLRKYRSDPRVERFHHSRQNVKLRPPTLWLWQEASARFVSKVDDDCLVSPGWLETFSNAFDDNPQFGVVGSWRPYEEDFRPDLAKRKIEAFNGGHRLLRNHWVQGSGYLLPRSWIERMGIMRDRESFTHYCLKLARAGAINGFYFPFVREEHMDDPRSPNTLIHTNRDLQDRMPLSARAGGVSTVDDWVAQLQKTAVALQKSSLDLADYTLWRRKLRLVGKRARMLVGGSRW